MKDWHQQITAEEQRLFDLLADGELDENRRRELLASLDERPEGWRHCAVALLEAQAWRRHTREVTQVGDLSVLSEMPSPTHAAYFSGTRPRHNERFRLFLAMAASFLAAFGLSWVFRGGVSDSGAGTEKPQVVQSNGAERTPQSVSIPADRNTGGMVTLAADGQDSDSLQVPYVSADRFDPSLFAGQPSEMPEDLIRELRRTGHEVHRSRQIVPFDLQDGRRLVLPVDQMDVRFVGREFQ